MLRVGVTAWLLAMLLGCALLSSAVVAEEATTSTVDVADVDEAEGSLTPEDALDIDMSEEEDEDETRIPSREVEAGEEDHDEVDPDGDADDDFAQWMDEWTDDDDATVSQDLETCITQEEGASTCDRFKDTLSRCSRGQRSHYGRCMQLNRVAKKCVKCSMKGAFRTKFYKRIIRVMKSRIRRYRRLHAMRLERYRRRLETKHRLLFLRSAAGRAWMREQARRAAGRRARFTRKCRSPFPGEVPINPLRRPHTMANCKQAHEFRKVVREGKVAHVAKRVTALQTIVRRTTAKMMDLIKNHHVIRVTFHVRRKDLRRVSNRPGQARALLRKTTCRIFNKAKKNAKLRKKLGVTKSMLNRFGNCGWRVRGIMQGWFHLQRSNRQKRAFLQRLRARALQARLTARHTCKRLGGLRRATRRARLHHRRARKNLINRFAARRAARAVTMHRLKLLTTATAKVTGLAHRKGVEVAMRTAQLNVNRRMADVNRAKQALASQVKAVKRARAHEHKLRRRLADLTSQVRVTARGCRNAKWQQISKRARLRRARFNKTRRRFVGCFPGQATVTLEGGAKVAMRDLQHGDKVQTVGKDGAARFSEVFFFGHKDAAPTAPFTCLKAGSSELCATGDHFVVASQSPSWAASAYTRARDVTPGMFVFVDGKAVAVAAKSERWLQGLYNPFTLGGAMVVVDGVVATTHSEWFLDSVLPDSLAWTIPTLYEMALAPARALYSSLLTPELAAAIQSKLAIPDAAMANDGLAALWKPYAELLTSDLFLNSLSSKVLGA